MWNKTNIEEYVSRKIELFGYGRIDHLALDAEFFKEVEEETGEIKDIMPITSGLGGITWLFNSDKLEGCFILFESGNMACIQSDGEYVDICYAEKQ